MAHSGSTQYYDLPQFIGSDILNPLTDINGAFEDIDNALHEVAVNSAGASEKADDAKDIADALDGRVTTVESAVSDIQSEEANIISSMAEPFNASKVGGYAIGDFVTYEGNLYEFTVAHAGAWSASDVHETTVGEMLKSILGVIAEPFSATHSGGYEEGDYVIYNNNLYKFVHSHTGGWNVSDVNQVTVASEMKASAGALASLVGKTINGAKITVNAGSGSILTAFNSAMDTAWNNKPANAIDIVIDKILDMPCQVSRSDTDNFDSFTITEYHAPGSTANNYFGGTFMTTEKGADSSSVPFMRQTFTNIDLTAGAGGAITGTLSTNVDSTLTGYSITYHYVYEIQ